jgi:hypothetical protein
MISSTTYASPSRSAGVSMNQWIGGSTGDRKFRSKLNSATCKKRSRKKNSYLNNTQEQRMMKDVIPKKKLITLDYEYNGRENEEYNPYSHSNSNQTIPKSKKHARKGTRTKFDKNSERLLNSITQERSSP